MNKAMQLDIVIHDFLMWRIENEGRRKNVCVTPCTSVSFKYRNIQTSEGLLAFKES